MTVFFGADHGGFALKEELKSWFSTEFPSDTVNDYGAIQLDLNDDYPSTAFAVAEAVNHQPESRGILLCRFGSGMAIAANKVSGIRAAVGQNEDEIKHARQDNDVNILCLAADQIDAATAQHFIRTFLTTPFSGAERHVRRLAQIHARET